MDPQQSQAMFMRADQLFRNGESAEALELLRSLDRAYANRLDILFPMLLCLERVGNLHEAIKLADRLVRDFGDPRARKVRERMAPTNPFAPPGPEIPRLYPGTARVRPGIGMNAADPADGMPGLNMNALAGLLDDEPRRPGAPPPVPKGSVAAANRRELMMLGAVAVGLFVFLGFFCKLLGNQWNGYLSSIQSSATMAFDASGRPIQYASEADAEMAGQQLVAAIIQAGVPAGIVVTFILVVLLFVYLATVPAGWVALRAFNNLPNDDFVEDMKDIGVWSLYATLLMVFLPILSTTPILVMISRHYKLSCGSLFLSYLVWQLVYGLGLVCVYFLMLPFAALWGIIL